MGADFTFAKFPYFDMGDDAREHFRTMIDNLDEDQLNEWEEWHGEPLDKEDLLAVCVVERLLLIMPLQKTVRSTRSI
jgi:hypothetical protein